MVRLFGRKARVTIGTKGAQGSRYEGFRISFSIEKDITKNPNKAKISIYNLAAESAYDFSVEKNLYVILETQYSGGYTVLFEGDVKKVVSKMAGSDRVTEIEAYDGHNAINKTFITKTFKSGIDTKDIVNTVVKEIKDKAAVLVGNLSKNLVNTITGKENGSTSLSGAASDVLDTLLRKSGRTFSIQNNELKIVEINKGNLEDSALLTPTTGMLGSPFFTDKGVQVKALLQTTKFIPGNSIQIDSRDIKGIFIIKKVMINGDTRSNSWEADIYAEL